MICDSNFVFKSITPKDGGEFKRPDGSMFQYESSYELKVDEENKESGEVEERKFKISKDETALIDKLKKIPRYQEIVIRFDVSFRNLQGKTNINFKILDCGVSKESTK